MNRRKFLGGAPLSLSLLKTHWTPRVFGAAPDPQTDAEITDFDAQAFAALPVEERYHFVKVLTEGHEESGRDPNARPESHELALPSTGWTMIIPSDSGQVLRLAAETFRSYLAQSMQTSMRLETRPLLANWSTIKRAIVAAPKDKLPGCGLQLKG
jgi:hypothetical protein